MNEIKCKRVYDPVEKEDGHRILVDRIWPRGIKKQTLELSEWAKEIAPTNELRKQFGHQPEKFEWFSKEYKKELDKNEYTDKFIRSVKEYALKKNVTLIYSAKDTAHNQAIVLQKYIQEHLSVDVEKEKEHEE